MNSMENKDLNNYEHFDSHKGLTENSQIAPSHYSSVNIEITQVHRCNVLLVPPVN